MTNLSVNVNKIALLRNSRLNGVPNLVDFVMMCIEAGVDGVTVHPREDARHIMLEDLKDISDVVYAASYDVEFNIEGDPREDLLNYVQQHVPCHQFTLVPVTKGELTSTRGWCSKDNLAQVTAVVQRLKAEFNLKRVSMFADATEDSVMFCKQAGADAIEFYTGDYALCLDERDAILGTLVDAAQMSRDVGMRIHAGHDLDLNNLPQLLRAIQPDELSIGHALVSDALVYGFRDTLKKYMAVIKGY